ncbi:NAD(P)H-dependent oxidoreductase [Chitinophaga pendula]|uniref:FMN-dependent NADH-azoreductase n=1 Tax=Chitinophaga TaxID=79328 RepID=UPI000BB03F07|nr:MULTISPECIES: NAD(P)H-dependent oxidoreductase [Chitinophaga]ASZ13593.1 FMN-dependent NADH-azoreductase [Chitinophaga sp. MD30]UCJ08784.1 NAD(P)H-dependent oxidoreductase [Chitinophaga pendula]
MKNILHIISSPRGEASYSIRLANGIIERLQATYPGSVVTVHNLISDPIPHLQDLHIQAFFTPDEQWSTEVAAAARISADAIAALQAADIIVIGVPFYNFSIHSSLKAWLDQVVRRGITFQYTENGPEGLLTGKKVYLASASGGVYSEGPMKVYDFSVPYLQAVLGMIGLTDITVVRAEGTAIPQLQETALEKGLGSLVIS